jgi:hypothetical protein
MQMSDIQQDVASEKKSDLLDECITELLNICNEVQDRYSSKNSKRPHWAVCSNKLHTCYIKVKSSEAFRDMFVIFHNKYRSEYCKDIFTSEGNDILVNDEFFKSIEIFLTPGEKDTPNGRSSNPAPVSTKKNSSSSSWGNKPILKGPVIYYTYKDPKAAGVCLPIGEIYRIATTIYEAMEKDGEDDSEVRSLPARLLLSFYKVISTACGKECEGNDVLQSNITVLEGTISEVSVDTPDSSNNSGPFGVLKQVFKQVLPTLTKKNGVIPPEVSKNLSKVMESNTLDSVGDMFTQISGSIQKGAELAKQSKAENKSEVATMLDCISETIKSEPVAKTMTNIANQLNQLGDGGILAPPSVVPKAQAGPDAGDQD